MPVNRVRNATAKDSALTVKLGRLVNSARYGVSHEIRSIDGATMVVDMSQVRTLARSSGLSDAFPVVEGLKSHVFWQATQTGAGYAQWLATRMGSDRQHAWLNGFTVRLGELSIVEEAPKTLPKNRMHAPSQHRPIVPAPAGSAKPPSSAFPKARSPLK